MNEKNTPVKPNHPTPADPSSDALSPEDLDGIVGGAGQANQQIKPASPPSPRGFTGPHGGDPSLD